MSSIHTKPSSVSPLVSISLSVVILLCSGLASQAMAQGPQDFIVSFRDGTIPDVRAVSVGNAGAAVRFNYARINAAAVRIPNANALAALQADPRVIAIIPDRPVSAFQKAQKKPDNPGGGPGNGGGGGGGGKSKQEVPKGVARVGQPGANSDGTGIGVAVLDTGVDLNHDDLNAVHSFSAFGGSCQDDGEHGTHVAGIIAALDNDIDVIGVAPMAQIYCVKVLDSLGNGSDGTVMAGLDWVLDNHLLVFPNITVVNMSLGRPGTLDDNTDLRMLVQLLHSAGVSVVVAAGNDPFTEVSQQVPAGYPEVIAVASTSAETGSNSCRILDMPIAADTASYFTTDGAFVPYTTPDEVIVGGIGVTVSAPGAAQEDVGRSCRIKAVGILSTRNGGGTTRKFGTSMAAPHVAGIVARLNQSGPLPVENIRSLLRLMADQITVAPLDSPSSAWDDDGEREGIAQAPAP